MRTVFLGPAASQNRRALVTAGFRDIEASPHMNDTADPEMRVAGADFLRLCGADLFGAGRIYRLNNGGGHHDHHETEGLLHSVTCLCAAPDPAMDRQPSVLGFGRIVPVPLRAGSDSGHGCDEVWKQRRKTGITW